MFVDYYRLLDVIPSAATEAIHRRYRWLVARCHPDRHMGDPARRQAAEQRLKAINAAHDVLKDPSRRAAYDALRARRLGTRRTTLCEVIPYAGPLRPRPRRPARPQRIRALVSWAIGLAVVGLLAFCLAPWGNVAPGAIRAGLLSAAVPDLRGPAAVLQRFVAAYHAGDIPGAADTLDPQSAHIVITTQGPLEAGSSDVVYEGLPRIRRLLAAGRETRSRGALPPAAACREALAGESPQTAHALLACLGGLAGGVEFYHLWGPVGPVSTPIASASGRFYVLSPARRQVSARAVFTLRRRADGWKITAIVLRAPEP